MSCSSLPGSPVQGILQARILEWLSCYPSGDLTDPGLLTCRWILYIWATRELPADFKCSSIGTWLPTHLSIYISSSGNWTYYMTDSKSVDIQGGKRGFWMGPLQWSPSKRGAEEAPPASCQWQRTGDRADKTLTLPGRARQSCSE